MARYYADLREYITALEQRDKLVRIRGAINKDTEMHPLVRLQFRGLPEMQRKAFLFEHVVDSGARRYDMPVVVGCTGGSRDIYALGLQADDVSHIYERWAEAQTYPIPPVEVARGPVHEHVYTGTDLGRIGGLGILPVPISTPGFDNAPYTSASHWASRDPETGRYNLGNYRGQIKAPLRIGCSGGSQSDLRAHWKKYRARGQPMPAAIVLGVAPNLSYCACARLPADLDEYHIAGGIAREPVELVRCKTVDLLVPAHAEIVVEGIIPTEFLELEGPFGEYPGYMATMEMTFVMEVTAICHRDSAIYESFISQFPPGENSIISGVARENLVMKCLRVDQGMDNVLQVVAHESTGSGYGLVVIQVREPQPEQTERIFEAIPPKVRSKVTVLVDDDIDPSDADSVNWAIAFRCQPLRDIRMAPMAEMTLDPSIADPADPAARGPLGNRESRASCMCVDATRKWPYPPTSLPRRDYMERALERWRQEGLPELHLKTPWYGANLGYWPAEREEEAELAVQGRHYETGEKFAQRREYLSPGAEVR